MQRAHDRASASWGLPRTDLGRFDRGATFRIAQANEHSCGRDHGAACARASSYPTPPEADSQ
jgi:hypothetical protein